MDGLLIIDVQNDFCPGGALAVPQGDEVVPVINQLLPQFDVAVQTQDWHPKAHHSFASSHDDKEPFDTIELHYGEQVLWPDHCIQGSAGAAFHPDLGTDNVQQIIRKGFRKEIDSYSAFFENDQTTPTGLTGYLKERDVDRIFLVGLATDFCVKWSATDGRRQNFDVIVVEDAVRGIDQNGSVEKAWNEMKEAGVEVISSGDVQSMRS